MMFFNKKANSVYTLGYYSERQKSMLIPPIQREFENGVKNVIVIRSVLETNIYTNLQDVLPLNFDGMEDCYFNYGCTLKRLTLYVGKEPAISFENVSFQEAIEIINNRWL